MRITWLTCFAVLLAACSPKKAHGQPDNAAIVSPRSPGERAFDEKLAAIHEKWMGTAWTFTGTSQKPRQGSIACGYFVTTTLEQAGVKLDRVRLAQAASEKMILAITKPETVKRYSDATLKNFLEAVRKQGEGFYIVGLDYHTGFLRVALNREIVFIHSGPGRGVVKEKPEDASELANSRYRVTGKITETSNVEQGTDGKPPEANQPPH